MKYPKSSKSVDEQVDLLIGRGLKVPDRQKAKNFLKVVSYYRFSGFAYPFLADKENHRYHEGVEFSHIEKLYVFDRRLRLLIIEALEVVEVAIKASVTNAASDMWGPHWYMDSTKFLATFDHGELIDHIKKETGFNKKDRNSHVFLKHYYGKYTDPELPPIWMVAEALSFGQWSRMYSGLADINLKKLISGFFSLHHNIFQSWIGTMSYLRNSCAHHERLWNKDFRIKPKSKREYATFFEDDASISAQLMVVRHFMRLIAPNSDWHQRIKALIREPGHPLSLEPMGLPTDWDKDFMWL